MFTKNSPDLYKIPGLSAAFSELLLASGVNSADELARSQPSKLLRWMEEVNSERRIVRRLPSLDAVNEWVETARSVPH